MSARALTLAIRLLGSAAAAAALGGTSGCGDFTDGDCGGWEPSTSLELGVSANLHAVAMLHVNASSRTYAGLAVGAEGTIVVWGHEWEDTEMFVEVTSLGTAALRGISAQPDSWWIVGDGGTAAVSGDHGQTWVTVELPTTANLHAIARFGSQVIMVGDEVVLVQNADGTWDQIAAPGGAWGQLRGLHHQGEKFYAVGLGGVIWETSDPHGDWVAAPSGTQADLFAIGGPTVIAVGSAGTVLIRKASGWVRVDNDVSVDLLGYANNRALGANGELFDVD